LNVANGGVLYVPLGTSVDLGALGATLTVRIYDEAGHLTEVTRKFSAAPGPIHAIYAPLVGR
jgi:hypothetical protein